MSESATQVVDLFKMRSESVAAAIESDEGLAVYPTENTSHMTARLVLEVGEYWSFIDAECIRNREGKVVVYAATYVGINGSDRQEVRLSDKDPMWILAAHLVATEHGR